MVQIAELELADWRRRVADLYVDVRRLSAADPQAAHAHWRRERERLFRDHPQSSLPSSARARFHANHFPYDPAWRFEVRVETAPTPHPSGIVSNQPEGERRPEGADAAVPVSTGGSMAFRRIGRLTVPFPDGTRRLALFWLEGYAGGLFLPFRDATNGAETYGGGRYLLDAAKSADLGGNAERGTLLLDFNFAFQPSCAFDPRWACPLSPPENRLDLAVRAGEQLVDPAGNAGATPVDTPGARPPA